MPFAAIGRPKVATGSHPERGTLIASPWAVSEKGPIRCERAETSFLVRGLIFLDLLELAMLKQDTKAFGTALPSDSPPDESGGLGKPVNANVDGAPAGGPPAPPKPPTLPDNFSRSEQRPMCFQGVAARVTGPTVTST